MGTVVVNVNGNRSIAASGNNIVFANGKVFVDGREITPEGEGKEINVTVEGDITSLNVNACNEMHITGNVGSVKTVNGNVKIEGDVSGDVKATSGNIVCKKIGGNVDTVSGNIVSN